jgi:hypothetical protein
VQEKCKKKNGAAICTTSPTDDPVEKKLPSSFKENPHTNNQTANNPNSGLKDKLPIGPILSNAENQAEVSNNDELPISKIATTKNTLIPLSGFIGQMSSSTNNLPNNPKSDREEKSPSSKKDTVKKSQAVGIKEKLSLIFKKATAKISDPVDGPVEELPSNLKKLPDSARIEKKLPSISQRPKTSRSRPANGPVEELPSSLKSLTKSLADHSKGNPL